MQPYEQVRIFFSQSTVSNKKKVTQRENESLSSLILMFYKTLTSVHVLPTDDFYLSFYLRRLLLPKM